ncbi:uncharacterized protein LOC114573901 isoform X1 [Lates japonicus]
MHGYKYPPRLVSSSEDAELRPRSLRTETHREIRRLKMLCSRCMLPFLALYLLLEEISAAVLPTSRLKNKREVNWLDQELFSRLPDGSDQGDLSVGDAGEAGRGVDSSQSETEHLSLHRQHQNQFQYQRKPNEKRRKVIPLDSIGSFQMSSLRNRKASNEKNAL